MAHKIPVVGFFYATTVHPSSVRFKVPDEGCKLIGVWDEDNVKIEVERADGQRFRLTKTLKSGREIYGNDEPGERITVWVSNPKLTEG